jgi:hypothetical protein
MARIVEAIWGERAAFRRLAFRRSASSATTTRRTRRAHAANREARRRRRFVKAKLRVHGYADGLLALFHGPRKIAAYAAHGVLIEDAAAAAKSKIRRVSPLRAEPVDGLDKLGLTTPPPGTAKSEADIQLCYLNRTSSDAIDKAATAWSSAQQFSAAGAIFGWRVGRRQIAPAS